jgi:hypothetical protein
VAGYCGCVLVDLEAEFCGEDRESGRGWSLDLPLWISVQADYAASATALFFMASCDCCMLFFLSRDQVFWFVMEAVSPLRHPTVKPGKISPRPVSEGPARRCRQHISEKISPFGLCNILTKEAKISKR